MRGKLKGKKAGAKTSAPAASTLVRTGPDLPPPGISARNAHLIALLDSFDTGDADQQRRDLAEFQAGLDAARPGQRSIFSEGINP